MAVKVTDVKSWRPADIAPVTGALRDASNTASGVVDTVAGAVKAATALMRLVAQFAPTTTDPAFAILESAITAAQKKLEELTSLSGNLSVLLVPPISGGTTALNAYIQKKLSDTKDPLRPPTDSTNTYHAGYLAYAVLSTPQGCIDFYKAARDVFGPTKKKPSNAQGFSMFRPTLKVSVVGGNPSVQWTNPHVFEIARGLLRVKDANGTTVSSIASVEEVRIWRRTLEGGIQKEKKISAQPYDPFISTYADPKITEGKHEYAVEFSVKLRSGATVSTKSNWVKINVTKKAKVKALAGGAFPQFMGMKASYLINDLDLGIGRLNQILEQFKSATSINLRSEINGFIDFIESYANQLLTRIQRVVAQLKRVVANLDTLANSGLSFAGYEGSPSEALSSIASQDSSSNGFVVGIFFNASSGSQLLATTAVSALKDLLGWGGEYRAVEDLAKQARNMLKAGAAIVENIENAVKTTSSEVEAGLDSFGDPLKNAGRLKTATTPSTDR